MSEVTETGQERTETLAADTMAGAAAPQSYLWQVPGKNTRVLLDFDVVDRLLQEVMRGFGVIPKRGIEVGGILLGSFGEGGEVRVMDFEPVSCQHTRGSSYLLSDEELGKFRTVRERWASSDRAGIQAVGFYRSHTREGFGLSDDDLTLFDAQFSNPGSVVLLVKPFATRVSIGALFFREEDRMKSDSSYQEFPFRRKELGGGDASAEPEPPAEAQPEPPAAPVPTPTFTFGGYAGNSEAPSNPPKSATPAPTPPRRSGGHADGAAKTDARPNRNGWIWIPLSFIFLLLGVILGVQVALSVSSKLPVSLRPPDPYTMHLTASPSGDSVHVRWDRGAPAIQDAPRGVLHIQDGASQQRVDLDALQLQNGSVIYRRATTEVTFRLEVMTRDRVTVTETAEFKAR